MSLPEEKILPEEPYFKRYEDPIKDIEVSVSPENNTTPEETLPNPEKNGFSRNQVILALSGIVLSILVVSGVAFNKLSHKNQPVATEVPTTPVETPQTTQEQEIQNLSKEGQDFITQYGDRYSDPISVFYSVKGYENSHPGGALMMDGEYINNYNPAHGINGDNSALGFAKYRIPVDTEITQEVAIDIFNSYTAKNLSLYMNLLAKNPSKDATAMIDNEFQIYCSDTTGKNLPALAFSADDKEIEKLMSTAKEIVAEYGSTANYEIAQASGYNEDPNMTSFDNMTPNVNHSDDKGNKIPIIVDDGVRLVVQIDTYNGDKVSREGKTLRDLQLTIIKQPGVFGGVAGAQSYNYLSIGQN